MSRRRGRVILLFGLSWIVIGQSRPLRAEVICGYGSEDPTPDLVVCTTLDWDPVPDGVFDSVTGFSSTFTVYTEWDYETPGAGWDAAELVRFAKNIFTDDYDLQIGDNLPDVAHAVVDYFSRDEEAGPGITILSSTGPHDRFHIYLLSNAQTISAGVDCVTVHIENGDPAWVDENDFPYPLYTGGAGDPFLSPERVAREGFAHEWQHVCHYYYKRPGVVEVQLDGGTVFDEFCSKMSEHIFGLGRIITSYDMIYDQGLSKGLGEYSSGCSCFNIGQGDDCLAASGAYRYREYALLGTYLLNAFPEVGGEDLLRRWLGHSVVQGDSTVYLHGLEGMSQLLGSSEYDPLFTGSPFGTGNDGRFRELLHTLAVAKFYNYQEAGLGYEPDRLLQWTEGDFTSGANSRGPRQLYGYLDDWNGCWHDNIHALPVYHIVSTVEQTWEGLKSCLEAWNGPTSDCLNCFPNWEDQPYPRRYGLVQITPYGPRYLVFKPPAGPSSGDLSVQLHIPSVYPCMRPDPGPGHSIIEDRETGDLSRYGLYFRFIGYDGLAGMPDPASMPLDSLGAHGSLLEERYVEHAGAEDEYSFGLSDFTPDDYDAVVLVMSQVDDQPPSDDLRPRTIPFEIRFSVLPKQIDFKQGTIVGSETWTQGSTIWVDGTLTVDPGASLTIEDGVQVNVVSEDAGIVNEGTLSILGSSASPVTFSPFSLPGSSVQNWAGLSCSGSSTTTIEEATFSQIAAFDVDDCVRTQVSVENSRFYMAHAGMEGTNNRIYVNNGDTVSGEVTFSGTAFRYVDQVFVDRVHLVDCTLRQNPSVEPAWLPLLTVLQGPSDFTGTTFEYMKSGLVVGNLLGSSGVTTIADCEIKATEGFPLGDVAITTQSAGHIFADGLSISRSNMGILCKGSRGIVMSNSQIEITDQGLGMEIRRDANVDIGYGVGGPGSQGGNTISRDSGPPFGNYDCAPAGGGCDPVALSPKVRVINRCVNTVYARYNIWSSKGCVCPDEFFLGAPIVYEPADTTGCCAGGGGFDLLVQDESPGFRIGLEVYPTPFNPTVKVALGIGPSPVDFRVEVIDVMGRCLRILAQGRAAGAQELLWDGRDAREVAQASGVYFIRARIGEQRFVRRCLLIK